jgi:hypothetical protein
MECDYKQKKITLAACKAVKIIMLSRIEEGTTVA